MSISFSRKCDHNQQVYQKLFSSVDKSLYNVGEKMILALYSRCNCTDSRDPKNVIEYQECTNSIISKSSSMIQKNLKEIELFSIFHKGEISIGTKLEQILHNLDIKTLDHAIAHIKNVSSSSNYSLTCSEVEGCLEGARELVIRLNMLKQGMYVLEKATAGLFLAYHHSLVGPYYGDIGGNEWPHIPLHEKPTSLEYDFDKLLASITSQMSNQVLQNVSLLDLPAFGSTMGTLKMGLKEQFVWPIKTNFALLKRTQTETNTTLYESYKTLTEDWAAYMNHLHNIDHANYFTSQMENNKYLNFTSIIKDDMQTFLTALTGNFLTFD